MCLLSCRRVLVLLVACIVTACAATDNRMVGLVFDPGADTAELADQISGDEWVMYRFQANDGQFLRVSLGSSSQDTAFIVYAPGEWPGTVLFDSEDSGGREYQGRLDSDGFHAVKVFHSQEASQQGTTSPYQLVITLTNGQT